MVKYFKTPIYVGKNEQGSLFVHKVDTNDPYGPTAYGHTKNKDGKIVMNWSVDLAKANLPTNWKQWE